jgi:hypothetical protein
MIRQILDAIAQYERHLIVGRTSRGQKKQFEEGRRVHQKLYCYEKAGKDNKGHTIWKPVESEIETYKYILKRYNEGASLRKIVTEVYKMNDIEKFQFASYAAKMGNILRKYQYTGYQLTLEGIDIYKKFRKNEINNIQILKENNYWIKSIPYPLELISIEKWVEVTERLQIRGKKMNLTKEARTLRANKDIGTGLLQCGECGGRFYYQEQKSKHKKTGWNKIYHYYFHNRFFHTIICDQNPKSFHIDTINETLKLFYFFFYMVFDNTAELIKESQANIKQTQKILKEKIGRKGKEIERLEKLLFRYQKAIETTEDIEIINVHAKNINSTDDKLKIENIELSKLKIEYENLNEKFNQSLLEMTYYDVKDKINNWFHNMTIEEQRGDLIKAIKDCFIYNHYMIIDTGKIVFLFDLNKELEFEYSLLDNLNKDIIYKEFFMTGETEGRIKRVKQKLNTNYYALVDVNLTRDIRILLRTQYYLIEKLGINFDLKDKTNLISFTGSRAFWSIERMALNDETSINNATPQ